MNNTNKQLYSTETLWEEIAGFSRAIRIDNNIYVAGTTASESNSIIIGKDDPAKQMHFILNKIEKAITHLGGTLKDVVRTRIYVSDIGDWEIVAKIHGDKFRQIRPVNTLIQATLVGDCLVEVEAEAIIQKDNIPQESQ
ncbi:Putative aminoacrylate peracid reductase RutC [Legionella massiliensis]|uniref:Putative aminoacrylate peracid reductase RutC n=1 Tax=Legionella massiliensis TaxID=1034943 RepID=A0A078KWD4_9GAMM|nr:RidA family protein [Legionella massiliensis]CDZ77312.1 Putative aminoacrylate peracid reductase RutC [Legionella massiliensis]CEE13050.1 Putative aminoacrylate peracid reductase RutC [Legionella massiliensis]